MLRRGCASRAVSAQCILLLRGLSTDAGKSKVVKKVLPESAFKAHKCSAPSLNVETTGEELMKLYKQMYQIRRLETAADNLYKAKFIRGFCHLYNGQEAVAVGMEAAITHEDHVITAYRDHGFALLRGGIPASILGELLGKANGMSLGKGGSMHMYSKTHNFFGGNGIVGAQVPVGAGLALASKILGKKSVSCVYYGDGAANQGQVFEAYNMAALWKLPVLFICENNHYGMGTSVERAAATPEFYQRADYIPGLKVDGMDVLAVKQGGSFAAEWARSGKGPFVLEMETYRYVGHSMSDPGTSYRTREEIDSVRQKRDPIARVRQDILDNQIATADELKAVEKEIKDQMDEAVKVAKAAELPAMHNLFENIYIEPTPVRHVELANNFVPK